MIPDKGSGSAALSDSKSNINTTTTSNPLMAPQSNRNVPDIESEMQRRPISFAELFTLTDDEGFRSFDVQGVPLEVIAKIVVSMLTSLDAVTMQTAIEVCTAVWCTFASLSAQAFNPINAGSASCSTSRPALFAPDSTPCLYRHHSAQLSFFVFALLLPFPPPQLVTL